jgi:hypothetical protein
MAPEQDRSPNTVRGGALKRSAGAVWFPASIAVAFAGFSAAVVVAHSEPDTVHEQPTASAYSAAQPQAAAPQAAQPRTMSQHGTVVAVTAQSITARSADGYTQTYLVTPNTTAVTSNGGESFTAATPFAINDQVAIQATVSSGTATATAVADRAVIGEQGVPMDSL